MKKTIYDVAKEAGVGVATVSRALNNSGYVSEETRAKIRKACTGYSRMPREDYVKPKTIGLVLSHDPEYFFVNSVYMYAMIGISAVAKERGFHIMLEINNQGNNCLRLFQEKLIDGVILMGVRQNDSVISDLLKGNYPFVLIGDYLKEEKPFTKIDIDDFAMAKEAVEHLINLGHERIGFIGGSIDHASCLQRINGYRTALAEAGLQVNNNYIALCDNMTEEKVFNLAKKLLYQPNRVSAILAFNDTVAYAIYRAAKALGILIPEGLSVIGFDDSDIAKCLSPSLTTVQQPGYQKGYQAATSIMDLIERPETPPQNIVLQGILIFRDSCTMPPKEL